MKNLFPALVLFLLPFVTAAQTTTTNYDKYVNDMELVNAQIKALQKSLDSLKGTQPTPPPDTLSPCKAGPEILQILNVKPTGLDFQFHGDGVTDLHYAINTTVRAALVSGDVKPTSSTVHLTYNLGTGPYTLTISGNNCKGSDTENFTIVGDTPPPIPAAGLKHEIILNLTGRGFSNSSASGLEDELADYVDKFRFSWGWGISGVRVLMRAYDWEPSPGQYQMEALNRLINWFRARGLSLSIAYWPLLKGNSPALSSKPIFNDGSAFWVVEIGGAPQFSETAPAYADPVGNEDIKNAVFQLSKGLYAYENAGYLALAGGATEEMVWPYRDIRLSGFSSDNVGHFRTWCNVRGVPFNIPQVYAGNGIAWYNKDETGKNFLRHNHNVLRDYFDNFANAVRAGSSKGRPCFFVPGVASGSHTWEQNGYLGYIAANAAEVYHSDGSNVYDQNKKARGINILAPTIGVPIDAEVDREDLGWSSTGFDGDAFARISEQCFNRGARVMHLAMHFDDSEINALQNSLKSLMTNWHGKAYTMPNTTGAQVVDITPALWGSESWFEGNDPNKYYKEVAPGFWGNKGEPRKPLPRSAPLSLPKSKAIPRYEQKQPR